MLVMICNIAMIKWPRQPPVRQGIKSTIALLLRAIGVQSVS